MRHVFTLCEQHITSHFVEQSTALGRKRPPLEKLKIQLWRNSAERNWSVQVNDKRYDSVTLIFVQQLVAQRLANAKKALIGEARRPDYLH
jgi:hypothetical protein